MKLLPFAVFLTAAACSASAQTDITTPGDTIFATTGSGDPGSSPGNEQVFNAIDDTIGTKYLNFDAGPPGGPGGGGTNDITGFVVTPSIGTGVGEIGTIVTGARFAAANDSPDRDPLTFTLEGSNDLNNFTLIFSGSTNLGTDPGRNTFDDPVTFANSTAYTNYRVLFTTLRTDPNGCCQQIAEVELLGTAVPEPASLGLLALGGVLFASRRRRSVC